MIELDNVAKVFTSQRGTVEALARIHLAIEDGEFICMVGPSGCGKTTILNLIAGLELPDEGEVLVDGRPVVGPGPDRGVMFQESALFPWLSVRQNVEFGLAMQGVGRAERRARALEWLRMVGVAGSADAFVHELSGGMRQRTSLARALALEPEILLMDEPFAALDVHSRAALHCELERVWLSTRKTVIFVTHDVGEAVRLGSRVIVLGRQPARVCCSLAIPLPRPRRHDDAAVAALMRTVVEQIDETPSGNDDREDPDGDPVHVGDPFVGAPL